MSCSFTREELVVFAEELAQKHWNRKLTVKIELVNRDWKRRQACYIYNPNKNKHIIRMSKKVNSRLSNEVVLGNLLHELVHWHLHTTGKNFSDDSEDFVAECVRVEAPISRTKSAQKAYGDYVKKKIYNYFNK